MPVGETIWIGVGDITWIPVAGNPAAVQFTADGALSADRVNRLLGAVATLLGRPPADTAPPGLALPGGLRLHAVQTPLFGLRLAGVLELAEIGGSETFVHVSSAGKSLVAQIPGVHEFALGEARELFFDPAELYCFDERGALLFAPER